MATDRSKMTVRIVSLHSKEAGDWRMGGTAEERLEALAEITRRGWALSQRPIASYAREAIPFALTRLADQGRES